MIKIYQIFIFLVGDLPEFIMKIAKFEMWRDPSILQNTPSVWWNYLVCRRCFRDTSPLPAKPKTKTQKPSLAWFLLHNAMHSIPSILTSFIVILSYSWIMKVLLKNRVTNSQFFNMVQAKKMKGSQYDRWVVYFTWKKRGYQCHQHKQAYIPRINNCEQTLYSKKKV